MSPSIVVTSSGLQPRQSSQTGMSIGGESGGGTHHLSSGNGKRRKHGNFSIGAAKIGEDKDFVAALKDLLASIQENPNWYPLFSPLLPLKVIEENEDSRKMDGSTRKTALKQIMVKIFQKMTKLVVEASTDSIGRDRSQESSIGDVPKMVFLFDDCQWFDPVSMEILLEVAQKCENVSAKNEFIFTILYVLRRIPFFVFPPNVDCYALFHTSYHRHRDHVHV
jgi:hypothetical protein